MPAATRTPTRVVGVEVDGDRVVAAHVTGTVVSSVRVVDGPTARAALAQVLADVPAGTTVRIAVSGDAQDSARVDTTSPVRSRADLAAVLATQRRHGTTALPEAGVCLGAHLTTTTDRTTGLVVAVPHAVVADCHEALEFAGLTGTVMPAALVAGPAGPLVLALRQTSSELTVCTGQVPVATTVLPGGGLDVLEALLGSGEAVGATRLADAMAHGGVSDPLAAGALDTWLADLAASATTTAAAWREAGLPVPTAVYVHGRGAGAVSARLVLADAGWHVTPTPPAIAGALLKVAPTDRAQAVGAYLAAVADPAGTGPLATLAHPDLDGSRARAATLSRRRRALMRTAGVLAAATLAATVPWAGAQVHHAWTQAQLRQELAAVAEVTGTDGRRVVDAAHLAGTGVDPQWLAQVISAAQQVSTASAVHASGTGAQVVLAAPQVSAVEDLAASVAGVATVTGVRVAGEAGAWVLTVEVTP